MQYKYDDYTPTVIHQVGGLMSKSEFSPQTLIGKFKQLGLSQKGVYVKDLRNFNLKNMSARKYYRLTTYNNTNKETKTLIPHNNSMQLLCIRQTMTDIDYIYINKDKITLHDMHTISFSYNDISIEYNIVILCPD